MLCVVVGRGWIWPHLVVFWDSGHYIVATLSRVVGRTVFDTLLYENAISPWTWWLKMNCYFLNTSRSLPSHSIVASQSNNQSWRSNDAITEGINMGEDTSSVWGKKNYEFLFHCRYRRFIHLIQQTQMHHIQVRLYRQSHPQRQGYQTFHCAKHCWRFLSSRYQRGICLSGVCSP